MKRFDFPLQRVMDIREKQVAIEEAKLARLNAEVEILDARRAALDSEDTRVSQSIVSATAISSADLAAMDSFRRYLKAQRAAVEQQREDAGRRTAQQREALLEARRRFELLGRLREKARHEWTREFDRELETIAAEVYLSRTHTSMDDGPRFAQE